MKIAVASGKGGTGKTLVATSLAAAWKNQGGSVSYLDADVEAPNGHLFLKPEVSSERFAVKVPRLKGDTCAGHGKCSGCAFNAIIPAGDRVIVFDELCHSCGACMRMCPDGALIEVDRETGTIMHGSADGLDFWSGRLDVGEARATPLIEGLLDRAEGLDGLLVIDSPPGTSCPAMAAVDRADLILLVAEPTPFGVHDLRLAVHMGKALGKPLAALINRCDLGDAGVEDLLDEERVPIVARIPFDRSVARAYAAGAMPLDECPDFRTKILDLVEWIRAANGEGEQ